LTQYSIQLGNLVPATFIVCKKKRRKNVRITR